MFRVKNDRVKRRLGKLELGTLFQYEINGESNQIWLVTSFRLNKCMTCLNTGQTLKLVDATMNREVYIVDPKNLYWEDLNNE